MNIVRNTTCIVIHCTAGHGDLASIQRFWKSKGWKSPGYHYYIDYDGKVTQLAPLSEVTNGVLGHNAETVHIAYRGGVDKTNVKKAMDTRTPEQKEAIICTIHQIRMELKKPKMPVKGHRDFSPDKNGNGVIESWERIKECPSFDAMPEYRNI